MFLTNVLLKKSKSKLIMVLMESMVSGHQCTTIRERLADKLEFIRFDPYSHCQKVFTPAANKHEVHLMLSGVQPMDINNPQKQIVDVLLQLRTTVSTKKFVPGEEEDKEY